MRKITIKGLLAHKRRLISTFLAVVVGIAFLSGTLMLSDTIGRTFDDLFASVFEGTDAYVRNETEVGGGFGPEQRGRMDAGLLDVVARVPGVALAETSVSGYAQIVDKEGETLGNPGMGAPTFGFDWGAHEQLSPFRIAEGRPPMADNEVVIDRGSAKRGDLVLGDQTTIQTRAGAIPVVIVGIARFGDADSPGGASTVSFTKAAAERYLSEPGRVDAITVAAQPDVSQEELTARIAAVLPEGVEVITGDAITKESQDDIREGLQFFTIFLTVFAVIALVVSTFSIYNTFSIIVAQRTRELGLLRAVGASRGQVLESVLGEALAVGFVASIGGLLGGFAIVGVLKAVLRAFGIDLPAGGIAVLPRTVIVALIVGVIVTLLSAVLPAVRAARVPPVAAMRDVAIEPAGRRRVRLAVALGLMVLGVVFVAGALAGGGGQQALISASGGVVLVLIGVLVLGPVVARPVGRGIGAPLPQLVGITGSLARENASRNPKRTANTAAALLIGTGIVAFFVIMAASIRHAIDVTVGRAFPGDFALSTNTFGFGGVSPLLSDELRRLPEVDGVTNMRFAGVKIDDDEEFLSALDTESAPRVLDLNVTGGSLVELGIDGLAVRKEVADDNGWELGTPVTLLFPDTGPQPFRVAALFERGELVADHVIGLPAANAHMPYLLDSFVYVTLKPGVTPEAGRAALERAAAPYPQVEVENQDEFRDERAGQINQLLGLVIAMMMLAVVIALMGIANTLSLSVHERTRELGLLRAVGMVRAQVRSMVRWESVIIALFGTVGGLGIGIFFAFVSVTAADEEALSFRFPFGWLVGMLIVAALAGVVAAVRPAARAARLDVLQAIATE